MNILKYVDVLIGLALVMLLLSPLVTAITQLVLWFARSRPSALRAGLRDLLLQLSGSAAAVFESATIVAPSAGNGTAVAISGFKPAAFDAQGRATCEIAPEIVDVQGPLVLATDSNLPMTVTLVRRGPMATDVMSEPTDGAGKATIAYAANAVGYESRRAHIAVLKDGISPVDATITWTVASGHDLGQSRDLPVTAGQPGVFEYPGQPPSSYALDIVVADASGTRLKDHRVKVSFERNSGFDPVFAGTTDGNGKLTLALTTKTDTGLSADSAKEIASAVLLHRMIATPGVKYLTSLGKKYYMGHVVEREEFIRILLELVANEGPAANLLTADRRKTLSDILTRNGIPFPSRTLAAIRNRAQELEKLHPEDAAPVRQSQAIIDVAQSDFVGKINNWFDQAMARVAARYTLWARAITVIGALIVAMIMRVDSLELLKRLSADDALRNSLVAEATNQQERIDKLHQQLTGSSSRSNTQESGGKPEPGAGATTAAGDGVGGSSSTGSETAGSQEAKVIQRNELEGAKAQLMEIQENLSILRSPQMAILPDRFFWQPMPRARLMLYEPWKAPFPDRLELVLGATTYPITPGRWRGDPLDVIRTAIKNSGAPVDVAVEPGVDEALLLAWEGDTPRLEPKDKSVNLVRELNATARYSIAVEGLPSLTNAQLGNAQAWQLVVGNPGRHAPFPITFTPCKQMDLLPTLIAAVSAIPNTGIDVIEPEPPPAATTAAAPAEDATKRTCVAAPAPWKKDGGVKRTVLAAHRSDVDWIAVLSGTGDDAPALGGALTFSATRGRVLKSDIVAFAKNNSAGLTMSGVRLCDEGKCGDVNLASFANALGSAAATTGRKLTSTVQRVDSLVLTSKRLGTIELRATPGQSRSSLLGDIEQVDSGWRLAAGQSWRGLILTWILLSLGAPFWYDVFKDLLKLRPALAKSEERQRMDRQTDTNPVPAGGRKAAGTA